MAKTRSAMASGAEEKYAAFFFFEAHQSWAVGPLGRWAVGPLGRWAVGPLGRWAVGPLMLTIAGLCALPLPEAQAGEWSLRWYKSPQTPPSGDYIEGDTGDDLKSSVTSPTVHTANLNYNLTATPVLFYAPEDDDLENDPMPETVSLWVRGRFNDSYTVIYEADSPTGANKQDGQIPGASMTLTGLTGSTSHLVFSGLGNTDQAVITPMASEKPFGKRIYTKPTKGAPSHEGKPYIVFDPVTISGVASLTDDPYGAIFIGGWFDGGLDQRSVTLSRTGAREERQELQNGEWHGYSDSIYSAHSPVIYPNDDLFYPLSIGVNYAGNWLRWGTGYNVSPSWTTSGFEPVDGTNNSSAWGKTKFGTPIRSVTNFHGIPYYNGLEGEPTGAETFDTTYTAVDNGDGATAKAYYHLTLHNPVEKDGADDISTYHITFPMSNGSDITYIGENSATESERPLVEVGHSTQYGYGITATVGIEGVASLLGLSAEASAQAESTTTITATTTKRVPHLTEGQKVYLVADHPFQRTHVRFWKYDEGGKVKRMLRISDEGVTPPAEIEVHHEAFQDTAAQATYHWSPIYEESQLDIGNLPHTPAPELPYDYSGGSS